MDAPSVWHEEIQIRSTETDFQKRWRATNVFLAMQEAATHHAAALGFGFEDMTSQHMIWILSRVRIRFLALPTFGERVQIETWPKGVQQRLMYMRDFILTSDAGVRLAEASTAWLLVDTHTHRILPPNTLPGNLPDNGGRAAIAEPLDKLNLPDGLTERLSRTADYSTIDLMGHVNSARYLEWALDLFPLEEHRARRLADLQINYINEIKPGECASLAAGPDAGDPNHWWVQGTNQVTGQKAFDAVLKFTTEPE